MPIFNIHLFKELWSVYLFGVTMKAINVLELYDSFWFEHSIMRGMKYCSSSASIGLDQPQIQDEPSDLKFLDIPAAAMDSSSMSDDNSFELVESFSPTSVLLTHSSHLFSMNKDVTEDSNAIILPKMRRSSIRKIRKNKTVAELEMEEVEGFMNLGFVFTEAERNSRLAFLIPGLKRLGKEVEDEDDDDDDERGIQRPYLSEAWEFMEWKKKMVKPLNWRIPEDTSNEASMKDNLKLWAHTVASLVG